MTTTLLTLHDPETARRYYIDGLWRRDTLYSLLADHAAQRPSALAVRDGARSLDWAALLRWVDAMAADLLAAGLQRGQRVSVWLPDRVEALVTFLACSRNGLVYNPLRRGHTAADVVALLERIGAAALVAQPGHGAGDDALALAHRVASVRRVYCVAPDGAPQPAGATPFPAATGPRPDAPPDENADKVVYLAFTSGTTGTPKGVMHSDNTLLANGRALVADWGHGPGTVLLALSPLSHHIGTVAIEQMLVAGMTLVTADAPPGLSQLDWIVRTGATYVMGVPTHALDLLAEVRRRGLDRLGAAKVFYLSGAPIPPAVAQQLLDHGIVPQSAYGMAESGSHQYTLPTDDPATITTTCGRTCRSYEVVLWDRENPDLEAAPGDVGEIGGRGASLMLGYFGNQPATEQTFNGFGWFMSGDLGTLDERGALRVVGRKKDVIRRSTACT